MPATYSIPRANAPLLNERTRGFTTEWYNFLRAVAGLLESGGSDAAAIAALQAAVAELQAHDVSGASIQGTNSVQSFGSLLGGLVQIQLYGDIGTPDPSSYYGTDALGARGFSPITNALVPTLIAADETYLVPANRQALFTIPIDIESGGMLAVDGVLAEVE